MNPIRKSAGLTIGLIISLVIVLYITSKYNNNNQLDHVIWAVPDLDQAVLQFEELSGVKPKYGGSHPGRGTRNNVVSAGELTYLEIIAPDPSQLPFDPVKEPVKAFANVINHLNKPEVDMFVFSTDDLEHVALVGKKLGFEVVGPIKGSRKTPDGELVEWTHVDFIGHDFGQYIPFAINWGNTVHPSVTSPKGAVITGITVKHPRYKKLRMIYDKLGIPAKVIKGDIPAIIVHMQSDKAKFDLKSGPGLHDYYGAKNISNF